MTTYVIDCTGGPDEHAVERLESTIRRLNARLPGMPSPYRPLKGSRVAYGRCLACERWLGVENVRRRFVWVQNPIKVPHIEEPLAPGWYCEQCLKRARQRS